MLARWLFGPDGRVRLPRLVVLLGSLVGLALFGSSLVVLTPLMEGNEHLQSLWVLFAVFLLKFPLIAFLWWLIVRNKEWPGRPVVWTEHETAEILDYLRAEARRAMDLPDGRARLEYLSVEAWHVADRAQGPMKADAVGVALEVDRLLERARRGAV
jgi:hypothetical protein